MRQTELQNKRKRATVALVTLHGWKMDHAAHENESGQQRCKRNSSSGADEIEFLCEADVLLLFSNSNIFFGISSCFTNSLFYASLARGPAHSVQSIFSFNFSM